MSKKRIYWVEYLTDDDQTYYHNPLTDSVRWDKPSGEEVTILEPDQFACSVIIHEGSELKNPSWFSTMKPYALVYFQEQRYTYGSSLLGSKIKVSDIPIGQILRTSTWDPSKGDRSKPRWDNYPETSRHPPLIWVKDRNNKLWCPLRVKVMTDDTCLGQGILSPAMRGNLGKGYTKTTVVLYPQGKVEISYKVDYMKRPDPPTGDGTGDVPSNEVGNEVEYSNEVECCNEVEYSNAPAAEESEDVQEMDGASMKTIVDVFKLWDDNGNGTIERDELEMVLKTLCSDFDAEQIDEIMEAADLDEDGCIHYSEFVQWLFSEHSFATHMFAHLKEKRAAAYKPREGEQLFVPKVKRTARLLLKDEGSFSYIWDLRCRFSEGAQGSYTHDGQIVTLTPEYFGEAVDEYARNTRIVTLGEELLDARGAKYKGCFAVSWEEGAGPSWLDPDAS